MRKIKVITDSCADMDKEIRDKYGIDYVRMLLNWGNEERFALCDWDVYTVKDLYDALRGGVRISTNQVTAQEFEEVFGKWVAEGYDIVYVACSTGLSGTFGVAQAVAKSIMEAHPECKIACVDTLTSCAGEAITAIEAVKLAEQGLGAEEIAEKATDISRKTFQYCTVADLTFLKRAGRVKAAAAFFGNLFGIKPIIISNDHGMHEAVKKVKGRKAALDTCVDAAIKSLAAYEDEFPVSERTLHVVHADCIEDAEYMAKRLREETNVKDIRIAILGTITGATTGPATVAIFGIGEQLTEF